MKYIVKTLTEDKIKLGLEVRFDDLNWVKVIQVGSKLSDVVGHTEPFNGFNSLGYSLITKLELIDQMWEYKEIIKLNKPRLSFT